jgi:hypothetical protein
LQFVANDHPVCVLGGETQKIAVTFSNPGETKFDAEICTRIFQVSATTMLPLGEKSWKKLEVLPQQVVLESAALDFPTVKVETKFLVQWLENTNHVVGMTEVWVYPTNLLAELKPLVAGGTLGVYDPRNQLKPLLKNLTMEFVDLENSGLEHFSGKLAIVGPFPSKAQVRSGLAEQIKALAKKNVAVVWLLPPLEKGDKLLPSFYSVAAGTNAVVVAQAEMVFHLPENPLAQLNLIYCCKLALKPTTLSLPDLTSQP